MENSALIFLRLCIDLPNDNLMHPTMDKNEPSRFLGEGMTFKAKLIGILEVNEARGNKMCQDALNDLKTAIRAAGEHKQRITISIAIDGLRLRDEKSGDCLYHHPVHKISFIAQDMSDSRAFGYIFGSPDTGHRFFGIKTDKTASQVVISMRDLFQVVFELKKKEIEMAKHCIEQRQIKYSTTSTPESIHTIKDGYESDKGKGKYPQLIKIRCAPSKFAESGGATAKVSASEAIADLLDLEHELNSIQQGINQMDRITPSDPFGPMSKGDPFLDPFEDSFASKIEEVKVPPPTTSKAATPKSRNSSDSCPVESPTEMNNQQSMFGTTSTAPTKSNFFSQFSPGETTKSAAEDIHWFDQETESLFNDKINVSKAVPTSSPITFSTPPEKPESEQVQEEKKSPVKPDVFMELDPLGTGWVKPYIDKKDFFQELKNPPKKVLKELLTEHLVTDSGHFTGNLESNGSPPNSDSTPNKEHSSVKSALSSASPNTLNTFPSSKDFMTKYSKIDSFDDTDPFEKTDPFLKNFSNSTGLQSLFNGKTFDEVFSESTNFDKQTQEEDILPPRSSVFAPNSIHGPLRVSLPPEKPDTNTPMTLSGIASKFRSSPSPPDESKSFRRKNYQMLKQSGEDRGDDSSRSPVRDEFFCTNRSPKISSTYSPKTQPKTFKDKPFQSMLSAKSEKGLWNDKFFDNNSDPPPPKPKAALFSIKPPPLPPKKQNQPVFKPPARPPSLDESSIHYDHVRHKEDSGHSQLPKSPKLESQKSKAEQWKHSERVSFPLLPPPPQRKTSLDKTAEGRGLNLSESKTKEPSRSILDITLNKLDNTGLENLAVTLGIPSDHIYNMTLQELTKRLSEKYLKTSEMKQKDTFQADFESNFDKIKNPSSDATPYDKYAVFKELIENDNKNLNDDSIPREESTNKIEKRSFNVHSNSPSAFKQEEDRYAALRQLSINAQKFENLSEDLDLSVEDDVSNKADNIEDSIRPKTEDSFTPINSMDLGAVSPIIKSTDWSGEGLVNKKESADSEQSETAEVSKKKNIESKQEAPKSAVCSSASRNEQQEEKGTEDMKNNWATFDKASAFQSPVQPQVPLEAFEDNENSPFSSDGKEYSYDWCKKKIKHKGRNDVPWKDEDESWDDYSAKESYWSDESSHDDRSPDKRREGRYQRRAWNRHIRKTKGASDQWCRRGMWNEDTEDEYEESWKNNRWRGGACDLVKKTEVCPLNCYEGYDRCNSRSEPWEENDRYVRCYTERRKRSESDDEYRRRCDSDTSDREYVWTFKRSHPEGYSRSEKQKQYHMLPYTSRNYPDRCHEPRGKNRKRESHKRPSSASEPKRNYEKMYSQGDYPARGKGTTPEGNQSPTYHKDFRYCCGPDSSHHYNSYDRRLHMIQSKKANRNRKTDSDEQFVMEKKGSKMESHDFYKSSWHKTPESDSRGSKHFQFEDDFTPETPEKSLPQPKLQSPKRDASKSPRKKKWEDWPSTVKDEFQAPENTENFASFGDDFKSETEKPREEVDKNQTSKQYVLGKNHFSVLTRQESSASLRKSESINIFSRENDPFEDDDFFSTASSTTHKLSRFTSEKSKSNSNVSDTFMWKEIFGDSSFHE